MHLIPGASRILKRFHLLGLNHSAIIPITQMAGEEQSEEINKRLY